MPSRARLLGMSWFVAIATMAMLACERASVGGRQDTSASSATADAEPSGADAGSAGAPGGGAGKATSRPATTPPDAGGPAGEHPVAVRRGTSWRADPSQPVMQMLADARKRRRPVVEQLFAKAAVRFPPAQVLLRGFKREKRLELWAAGTAQEPLTHVTTYEICAASGELGPKRREGDGQTPEGFYTLTLFNAKTPYHLAMLVSYPSLSDRILGDPRAPGSEIMIHGNCVSIGCIAITDERIEELWQVAHTHHNTGGTVHVHLFPSRDMTELIRSGDRSHRAFWQNLAEGHDAFARTRKLPHVTVDRQGRYQFR